MKLSEADRKALTNLKAHAETLDGPDWTGSLYYHTSAVRGDEERLLMVDLSKRGLAKGVYPGAESPVRPVCRFHITPAGIKALEDSNETE